MKKRGEEVAERKSQRTREGEGASEKVRVDLLKTDTPRNKQTPELNARSHVEIPERDVVSSWYEMILWPQLRRDFFPRGKLKQIRNLNSDS